MKRHSRFLTLRAATLGVLAALAVAFGADDLMATTHSATAADRQSSDSSPAATGRGREL